MNGHVTYGIRLPKEHMFSIWEEYSSNSSRFEKPWLLPAELSGLNCAIGGFTFSCFVSAAILRRRQAQFRGVRSTSITSSYPTLDTYHNLSFIAPLFSVNDSTRFYVEIR